MYMLSLALQSVLNIDQDRKQMTVYLYLVTHWLDPELSVHISAIDQAGYEQFYIEFLSYLRGAE